MFSRTKHIDGAFQLFRLGRYDLCRQKAMEILREFPDDDMAYYILSISEMEQGKLKQARKHIYKAIELDPEYAQHYNIAAMISTKKGEFEKGLKESEEALRINNKDAFLWEVKGWNYYNLMRYDDAWECCQQGLMLEPEHTGCLRQRALILEEREKHEEAAASAREFLGHDPENDKAHFILARNLWLAGKAEEAVKHYREAMRLKPGNKEAREGLRKSLIGANWPLMKHYLRAQDKGYGRFLTVLAALAVMVTLFLNLKSFPGGFILGGVFGAVGLGFATFNWLRSAPQFLAEFFLRDDNDFRKIIFKDGVLGRMISWIALGIAVAFLIGYFLGVHDPLLWLGIAFLAFVPLPSAVFDDLSENRTYHRIVFFVLSTALLLGLGLSFTSFGGLIAVFAGIIASIYSLFEKAESL